MITAAVVLYRHTIADVRDLFESLAKDPALGSWVVVNNGGANEACEFAASLGAQIVKSPKNLGFGGANNLAFEKIKHEATYHLLINPDISIGPEVIGTLRDFMDRHPDIGLTMPCILNQDGTEQRLCKLLPSPFDLFARRFLGVTGKRRFQSRLDAYEMRGFDLNVPRGVPCLSGCCMFLRVKAIDEVGLFDERYFMYMEDVDLCRRIGRRYRTVFYPNVSVRHGYAKGSYRSKKLLTYHIFSAVRYFNKWGWFYDSERRRLNASTDPLSDPTTMPTTKSPAFKAGR